VARIDGGRIGTEIVHIILEKGLSWLGIVVLYTLVRFLVIKLNSFYLI